jgi:hypothetical protein
VRRSLDRLVRAFSASLPDQFANQLTTEHFSVFASFYSGSVLHLGAADYLLGNSFLLGSFVQSCHIFVGDHEYHVWFV